MVDNIFLIWYDEQEELADYEARMESNDVVSEDASCVADDICL